MMVVSSSSTDLIFFENTSPVTCDAINCSSPTNISVQDIELFPKYSPLLLQFAAMCCGLFMIIGILGNLITIVALLKCKKVSTLVLPFYATRLNRNDGSKIAIRVISMTIRVSFYASGVLPISTVFNGFSTVRWKVSTEKMRATRT